MIEILRLNRAGYIPLLPGSSYPVGLSRYRQQSAVMGNGQIKNRNELREIQEGTLEAAAAVQVRDHQGVGV